MAVNQFTINMNKETNPQTQVAQPRKNWVRRNMCPVALDSYLEYRQARKTATPEQLPELRSKMRKEVGKAVLKTIGAEVLYEIVGNTVGVGARDWGLSFSAKTAWGGDTSNVSLTVARYVASFVSPYAQEKYADAMIYAEWGVSVVRILVEQKIYKKTGIVLDPAATFLTPCNAGILEMTNKIALMDYEPRYRFATGLVGIYGNLVRLACDGVIYAVAVKGMKNAAQEQPASESMLVAKPASTEEKKSRGWFPGTRAVWWNRKGIHYYTQGNYDKAISCYDEAIKLDPNNSVYHCYKAEALCKQSKYDEAIACYDEAIRLNPKKAVYHNNKGDALYELERYDEALVCYDKAINLNPKNSYFYGRKADALDKLGMTDKANQARARAAELNGSK